MTKGRFKVILYYIYTTSHASSVIKKIVCGAGVSIRPVFYGWYFNTVNRLGRGALHVMQIENIYIVFYVLCNKCDFNRLPQ